MIISFHGVIFRRATILSNNFFCFFVCLFFLGGDYIWNFILDSDLSKKNTGNSCGPLSRLNVAPVAHVGLSEQSVCEPLICIYFRCKI